MFNFVRQRKYWYIISLLIIIPGIISLLFRGLNLGIDFTGGSLIELRFEQVVTVQEVRTVLAEHGLEQSVVQLSGENQVLIRTGVITEERNQAMVAGLKDELGGLTVLRNDSVGPVIGKELTQRAILALIIASIAMVVYITWRFEFKQGLAAVAALLHDALVTLSLFSIFWLQVDSAFVAAVLTILGYSINATIVIFDRVRENIKGARKTEPLESIIDRSLWQTLARSANTALTVLFMLVALYFLGGATLKTFVLALIIGVTSGTYSSVFISSQLWLDLKERWPKTLRPARAET
ncbi:MAG: protein translocase subunit SecF [Candidatus Desulforudis sp.]|nr:protein translocase subunit SecF [Desulforudis sp.]